MVFNSAKKSSYSRNTGMQKEIIYHLYELHPRNPCNIQSPQPPKMNTDHIQQSGPVSPDSGETGFRCAVNAFYHFLVLSCTCSYAANKDARIFAMSRRVSKAADIHKKSSPRRNDNSALKELKINQT